MDDLKNVEPISGKLGMPGSKYRLVPKIGKMIFVAIVVDRNPNELKLSLDASNVVVSVTDRFGAMFLRGDAIDFCGGIQFQGSRQ